MNLYLHTKNQFISFISPWHTAILLSWAESAYCNIFQSTSTFYKYVSTCKKSGFSSFCSRDIVDLKILLSDWPRAFWFISQELEFSQIWNLCKNTALAQTFIIDQIKKKILVTKFSNKFKKLYFFHIFGLFSWFFGQKDFFKKPAQQHMGPWHHADFQKKLMSQSQENCWTEGQKDGRTDRS